MKSNLTTFLKTVTGKAVVATGVVLLGFGGAAAAGLADVPSFTPAAERAAPQAQRDESTDATSDDSSDTSDDSSDTNDESSDESTDAATDASSGATSDDEATDDEATHGAIVSEFARTTELEGCEKGQAIAELASANAADHRQNPETDHDPCADETSADASSADASSAEESSDAAPEESSDDGSSGAEPTHGQIVSEFARTTELEGCEKGQAISELASSNAADHRQNPETDHEPCARDDDGEESADDAADTGETPTEISADESGATNAGPPAEAPGRSGEHRNDGNNGNNGNGNSGSRGNGNGRGK